MGRNSSTVSLLLHGYNLDNGRYKRPLQRFSQSRNSSPLQHAWYVSVNNYASRRSCTRDTVCASLVPRPSWLRITRVRIIEVLLYIIVDLYASILRSFINHVHHNFCFHFQVSSSSVTLLFLCVVIRNTKQTNFLFNNTLRDPKGISKRQLANFIARLYFSEHAIIFVANEHHAPILHLVSVRSPSMLRIFWEQYSKWGLYVCILLWLFAGSILAWERG